MSRTPYPAFRSQPRTARPGPPPAVQALSRDALQHHQRGQLAEAERLYRQILAIDPQHADTLHLLGVLAQQVGRNGIAIELIGKAIAIDKRHAAYHCNLGTAQQALGTLEAAAESYRRALALKPDLAEAQMNLGAVLRAQGKVDEAESRFRRALRLRPDLAEVHVNLGNILQERGELDEAAASHERALALKPEFAEALFNLGNTRQAQGRLDEAVANYRQALALKPGLAEAYGNLGNALQAQGKLDEAVAQYDRALALNPNYADAYYNLGNARQAQDRLDEALACYRRALELNPQLAQAHYNVSNTLHAQDKLEEAACAFERALAIKPDYADAHYNLGCVLEDLGRMDEALDRMGKALAIQPDYPQAQFGLALAQLSMGEYATRWPDYETRWISGDQITPMRLYPQPFWKGETLAEGRLLLWGEQGIGDEIMFANPIPDALRTGNRIVLDCDPRLKPLFARSFPQIEVVSGIGSELAPEMEIAAHLPTGSLPALYRTSEAAFAGAQSPFLIADPGERNRFRQRYSDGRTLAGLAWFTRNRKSGRKRSINLELLTPLLVHSGLRWIGLQYGDFDELEGQVEAAGAPILIDREVDQLADLDIFAAQIAALDLVVTIDNSTAHLAGALGVPVWLLLPYSPDWRWLRDRPDSPWYPSIRIFRQPRLGDWSPVIREVEAALAIGEDERCLAASRQANRE
jgi:tetratricopeptide (TPR) repeat protein